MEQSSDLERALAALPPPPPWLSGGALERWSNERRAIGAKHRGWRAAADGWGHLYDDAEHERRALAGNLAREIGALLEEAAAQAPATDALVAWMQQSTAAWVAVVRAHEEPAVAGAIALADFVEEFVDRQRVRALGRVPPIPSATVGRLLGLLGRMQRMTRAALFPGA